MWIQQHSQRIPFFNNRLRYEEKKSKREEIGDYWLTKTIGRGSTGWVKLGIHKLDGHQVAIKMIPRQRLTLSKKLACATERELAILQLLHHPNLIELHRIFQDTAYIYFVTEYAEGGELFHLLTKRGGALSETEARTLFSQLAGALAWCHAHHICHRDLKPENILLDKDRKLVKIADFGMATIQSSDRLLQTSCGSVHYASPEIVQGKPYYGPATDVWSCGVLLYVLLTGYLPFDDENMGRLYLKIKRGKYHRLPEHLPSTAKDLIRRMLTVDPSQRITMKEVLSHPWLVCQNIEHVGPVYDNDTLHGPMISKPCDIYGRTWETLKVLWRELDHDQILAALMAHDQDSVTNNDDEGGPCPSLSRYSSSSCVSGSGGKRTLSTTDGEETTNTTTNIYFHSNYKYEHEYEYDSCQPFTLQYLVRLFV
ncbi:hypothetical protein EC973_005982 [Apophysomyces ossiformis]|uniref:Protein kinase domain-containing protein n=1 Tax=Apophysomyces ossiformis TaxID=679940 RepID=A0A8H7BEL5_9FUNG|nr:hypothetical protein EC973_005982 [Apophysomyces ossiformis]